MQSDDPLVAHCITGALRSFVEPQIFGRMKSELVDSFSTNSRVFVVASEDCTINGTAASCPTDTAALERALAFLSVERMLLLPALLEPPPPTCRHEAARCSERQPGQWCKPPSSWGQFFKMSLCYDMVLEHERASGRRFDWVVRSRTDHLWKAPAPPAAVLPLDQAIVGNLFGDIMANRWAWVEDHLLVSPRSLADRAFRVVRLGDDRCLDVQEWAGDCVEPKAPGGGFASNRGRCHGCPSMWFNNISVPGPVIRNECLLGRWLRDREVPWVSTGLFSFAARKSSGPHTAVYAARPSGWASGGAASSRKRPRTTRIRCIASRSTSTAAPTQARRASTTNFVFMDVTDSAMNSVVRRFRTTHVDVSGVSRARLWLPRIARQPYANDAS